MAWGPIPAFIHPLLCMPSFRDIVALLIIILKCLLQHMSILLVLIALEHPEYVPPLEAVQASLTEIHKASI